MIYYVFLFIIFIIYYHRICFNTMCYIYQFRATIFQVFSWICIIEALVFVDMFSFCPFPGCAHGQASLQEAKGDAEFAATIQSNLAAAYAKKGDHNNALAAAEEVRSAWCMMCSEMVFANSMFFWYLSLIRPCPLQVTQIHTNSWNLSMKREDTSS